MTGRRLALIVANDVYEDQGLRQLRSPAADATALAEVLGDRAIADFEVDVVYNAPAHEITERVEDHFTDAKPDDLLLLHFSCHGLKNEAGDLFFAARNTRPERLLATAVAADFVHRCMRNSRARQMVLLLDCCYGGAFAQGASVRAGGSANVLEAFPAGATSGGRGRAVISASNSMQFSFEGADLADDQHQPSVFTAALVRGLRTGEADRDEDGHVSLNELYEYVFEKVQEQNPHQTPTRDFALQGELYLARSNRKRVVPAPLPRELAAALHAKSIYKRLGAVDEVRHLLSSSDLPTALGAHAALAEVVRNDIRHVAEAATAAIEGAAVAAAEPTLDFGEVEAGRESPALSLRLLGPPIARYCRAEPSDPWILVAPNAEGFDVSVLTDRIGVQRGSVTVTGPTGSINVDIDVTAHAVTLPPIPPRKPTSPWRALLLLLEALLRHRLLVAVGVAVVIIGVILAINALKTVPRTFQVTGVTEWLRTDIFVNRSDILTLTASGEVGDFKDRPNQQFSPDGAERDSVIDGIKIDALHKDPYLSIPHTALMAKFGESGIPFLVGSTKTIDPRKDPTHIGTLFLGINDSVVNDNTGAFVVTADISGQ